MTKYTPLEKHLENKWDEFVPMQFSDIEAIIKDDLPPSARKHRAWWSNNPSNSVITFAWLEAGYKTTEVDLEGETLVFRRVSKKPPAAPAAVNEMQATGQHPLFGCLKGTVTIPDDLDLTLPADPDWGARTYGADD